MDLMDAKTKQVLQKRIMRKQLYYALQKNGVPLIENFDALSRRNVHGGTTRNQIEKKVHEAVKITKENVAKYGTKMFTVLFFDEANATEAVGLIKEILCDKTIAGLPIDACENFKIVAACNPYRKHSKEMIDLLQQDGLGYKVSAMDTIDKLGQLPMRELV
ncbi:R213B-like protein [Mya arenaria]|uniref:R213B-like protein n=1 Tax=Mya arenaria TaxID=6604 RepID=A0ABY7G1Z9_MYAAR|nr:R213B-like protein [Mya arenaria]